MKKVNELIVSTLPPPTTYIDPVMFASGTSGSTCLLLYALFMPSKSILS